MDDVERLVTAARDGEVWIGTNRGVARHRPSQVAPRLQIKRLVADKNYLPEDLTAELWLPHTTRINEPEAFARDTSPRIVPR